MERQFIIHECKDLDVGITETELRRRFILAVMYFSDGRTSHSGSISDWWWTTHVLPVLLHGEPKQQDEWLDFAESLDDGLHHWSAGDGIGYLVETFRKMPKVK